MRGVSALGGRGFKAIILSLSILCLIYVFGSFLQEAAPYAKEVSETGFYPVQEHDESPAEPILSPEVTTPSDEDHPASEKWHYEAVAKIKDKIGSWIPMDKVYGAMLPPPWRDHSKSMEKPSNHYAPSSPKEERNVIVGKISIINDPENEYIDRAVRTHTAHDKRHGYHHYIMREQPSSNANENFASHMLSVLQAELGKPPSERLEWLYYFPETTIVLNPNIPLELFLPPSQNSTTLEARHLLYAEPAAASSSPDDLAHTVFAAKVHDWTVDLFTTLVARVRSQHRSKNGHSASSDGAAIATVASLLALPPPLSPKQHALALPNHWLNAWPASVPLTAAASAPTHPHADPADPDDDSGAAAEQELPHQVRRGSFILDLPLPPASRNKSNKVGGADEESGRWSDEDDGEKDDGEDSSSSSSAVQARTRFEHWLARAEARMPQWEAPLQETRYADEAGEFWERTVSGGSDATTTPSFASSVASSPAGYAEPGYTPTTAAKSASFSSSSSSSMVGSGSGGSSSQRVDKLKEEVLMLVRNMEASVHNWRQEVSEEVRRATESKCGRARETLAEVELDGSDEDEKMKKLQVVIGGLKKASSRLHRHTTHARHLLLSSAQLALNNATVAISTVHIEAPSSVAASNAHVATEEIKSRIQSVAEATLHLQSLLDRKDWSKDEVKAAIAAVEDAVAKVNDGVKQADDDRKKAKEIERLRREEENLAGMEAAENARQRQKAEANTFVLPKLW